MTTTPQKCAYCERNSDEIPLLQLTYQGESAWICPQHLPILIHKPEQLRGKLPGAESLGRSPGHQHE
jgi:hypothetical protein